MLRCLVAARESLLVELLWQASSLASGIAGLGGGGEGCRAGMDRDDVDRVLREIAAFCVKASTGCLQFVHQTFVEFNTGEAIEFTALSDHDGLAEAAVVAVNSAAPFAGIEDGEKYLVKHRLRHLVAAVERRGDAARVFCDVLWLMARCEMLRRRREEMEAECRP